MKLAKAEKIIGEPITLGYMPEQGFMASAFIYHVDDTGLNGPVLQVWSTTKERVIDLLVEKMYKERSRELFKRADYRCNHCGELKPLQAHHKIFRSHGRSDALSNLVALCADCHERTHKERKPK